MTAIFRTALIERRNRKRRNLSGNPLCGQYIRLKIGACLIHRFAANRSRHRQFPRHRRRTIKALETRREMRGQLRRRIRREEQADAKKRRTNPGRSVVSNAMLRIPRKVES